MTIVAAIEAAAIVAVVLAFLHHIRQLERAGAEERRVLADRIQQPDRLPLREAPVFLEPPPREDDQLNMVGRIHIDESFEG